MQPAPWQLGGRIVRALVPMVALAASCSAHPAKTSSAARHRSAQPSSSRQGVAPETSEQGIAGGAEGGQQASRKTSTTIPHGASLLCFAGSGEVRSYTGARVRVSSIVLRAIRRVNSGRVVIEERWDESDAVFTVIEVADDKLDLVARSKTGESYFQATGRYSGSMWPWESWEFASSGPIQVQAQWKRVGDDLVGTMNHDIGSSSWVISTITLRPAELRDCDEGLGDATTVRELMQ